MNYRTGFDLFIIALVHFRAQRDREPAFVAMSHEFYTRMLNDLRPAEMGSVDFTEKKVCGIPVRFDARKISFLLEDGEACHR